MDKEDPHRFQTDDELIDSKIDLSNSVLNNNERKDIMDMLKQKQDAFSLRDEIDTCPYFEVKLQLRDDTLSLSDHILLERNKKQLYKGKWTDWKNWV